jgi:large subunit ribosomal protein L4
MKQVSVLNTKLQEVEKIAVPERIFGAKWNADLVHQAVVTHQANVRNIVAHAKDRSEVSGGGKKPWKQKGTGRSRHGSIRSPLWKGGGVTHGPLKQKVYAKKINKKMKDAALFSVLSQKLSDGKLLILDSFPVIDTKTAKTKSVLPIIRPVIKNTSALLIASKAHKNIHTALRNVSRVLCISSASLNIYDVLKATTVVFEKDSVNELITRYAKASIPETK